MTASPGPRMRVMAIDPGPVESAYVVIDGDRRPLFFGKVSNEELREMLSDTQTYADWCYDIAAVEMIASYGMAVGADVFETCVWIGRFAETIREFAFSIGRRIRQRLVKRHPVKLHHCQSARAKDSNIRQALVDRFASGVRNYGKGTKAEPGWFYGFRDDVWQAYALAVYIADLADEGWPT